MPETVKERLYEIIFGTNTAEGRQFDFVLIYLILLSVFALMLDSIEPISSKHSVVITATEWIFTIIFTVEYGVRIYCSPKPWRYILSFYGIIDLLSVLPSYLSLFFPGANYLLIVRLMRVLRIFRILKLVRYLSEANVLMRAMIHSRRKIFVFFTFVLVFATIFGSLMYVVEGPDNGFNSIPKSIYWTVVTITTVGYGDITPHTPLGQVIAAFAMLTGYSIIAVPTGILTAELTQEIQRDRQRVVCNSCKKPGHDIDASFCKFCGSSISRNTE